ncbi:MAG TPA: virulence-associated E family protein [Magnetospirillum sp.]|nr:virulence-associated E family protein [Magnetospirillum sp.]
MMAGIPGEIVRPLSNDDFAKDVEQGERPGLTRADAQVVHQWGGTSAQATACEVYSPSSLESLRSAVASVRHSDTKAVSAILRDVAATGGLTAGEVGNLLRGLKEVSGLQMGELRAELDGHKRALARMNSKFSDLPVLAEDGSPKPVFANAAEMLRSNSDLANVLAFNEFAGAPFARSPLPWDKKTPRPWKDDDDHRLHEWFDLHGLHVPLKTVQQATEMVSRERRYHPVRDFFDALKWDGKPRLSTWLTDCLGVAATDYTHAVGRAWMISAVARVYKPGCKADYALIFEGPQGLQKSKAARILGGEWFTDDLADLGTKDSALQMQGVLIIEIAELSAMGKSSVDTIKSFIARQEDRFRSPYEKRVMPHPRQCVFVGTVNPGSNGYLTDETGNRRFWPVEITKVDEGKLAEIRDQLWAEAVTAYRNGEKWWITDTAVLAAAESEQQARMQDDPWSDAVMNYALACGQEHVTVSEILTSSAFRFDVKELEQKHLTRVAKILKRNGWKRVQVGNPKKWAYERPESPQSPVGTTSEPVS